MNVVHINSFDQGGAAIAAIRLHQGLLLEDINSSFVTMMRTRSNLQNHIIADDISISNIPDSTLNLKNYIKAKYVKRYNKYFASKQLKQTYKCKALKLGAEIITFPNTSYRLDYLPVIQQADIIHLHWVGDFLDFTSFFTNVKKPIVWSLHDENPYRGIFHYRNDELTISDRELIKVDREAFNIKKATISKIEALQICTPSEWLAKSASESSLLKNHNITVVPNGIDTNLYQSYPKEFARTVFGLPNDKKILLFVSQSLSNKRKGFDLLLDVINLLKNDSSILICAVGETNQKNDVGGVHFLGPISDERLLALAYSAADAFVLPSKEDNLPNTMLESLACGTPVIGFPIGGIKEHIIENLTGLLAENISASSLYNVIKKYLRQPIRDKEIIREYALNKFDFRVQARTYTGLYTSMLR